MTQPPTPGDMAIVDKTYADASRSVDRLVATDVTELERGKLLHELFVLNGGTLHASRADLHMRTLASVAVARLAALHHAIEQLADQWAAAAANVPDNPAAPAELLHSCAHDLRKLVDP